MVVATVKPTTETVLLLLLLLLAAATAGRADPFDQVNVTRLRTYADDFRQSWPSARPGQVKIRLRPAEPSSSSRSEPVCGYAFTAAAAARSDSTTHAAAVTRQMLSACQASSCERTTCSTVPGARVATLELEAAGAYGATVADLCFGTPGDAGGRVRSFCADVELLIACQRLRAARDATDIDFGSASIRLWAARPYACRKIVFRDVDRLIAGFESLVGGGLHEDDVDDARRTLCDGIEFVDSEDHVTRDGCVEPVDLTSDRGECSQLMSVAHQLGDATMKSDDGKISQTSGGLRTLESSYGLSVILFISVLSLSLHASWSQAIS